MSQEDHENVAAWLNLLPDLPRMVVIRRYGLDGRDSETLSAIGERLGTTRERIRQIQVQALRLLRRMVEAERIPADAAIFDQSAAIQVINFIWYAIPLFGIGEWIGLFCDIWPNTGELIVDFDKDFLILCQFIL